GIRDFHVTGVQTCALPISGEDREPGAAGAEVLATLRLAQADVREEAVQQRPVNGTGVGLLAEPAGLETHLADGAAQLGVDVGPRSEERRVGKEGSTRWTRA